jgi:hypothetical protein
VAAALLGAIGSAAAQDTALKGNGPDQGQSYNERYTGMVDNTNNSYKTWPVSVRALWEHNEAMAERYKAKMARAQQAAALEQANAAPPPAADANSTTAAPPASSR